MTSFPTTLVPADPDAASTVLGDLVKNHTDHHQAVDERLGELQAALGLITATGFQSLPTMFDPDNATWSDGFWHSVDWAGVGDRLTETRSFGPDAFGVYNTGIQIVIEHSAGLLEAKEEWRAQTDDGAHAIYSRFTIDLQPDGTGGDAEWVMNSSDFAGFLGASYTASGSQFYVFANAGQTIPLLDLNGEFQVAPGGVVGGVAPSVGDSIKWDGTKWVAQA